MALSDKQYVWRCVKDDRVRNSHSARDGEIFEWNNPPSGGHPGEAHGCRCWAEPLPSCDQEFIRQEIIFNPQNSSYRWNWHDYLYHFYNANGAGVRLEDIGWLDGVIRACNQQLFPRLQNQIKALAKEIQHGRLHYTTIRPYEFRGLSYPLGEATVSTETNGKVIRRGNCLHLNATISYKFFDDFTDPADIRQMVKGLDKLILSKIVPSHLTSSAILGLERGDWTDIGGIAYHIHGDWTAKLVGQINSHS